MRRLPNHSEWLHSFKYDLPGGGLPPSWRAAMPISSVRLINTTYTIFTLEGIPHPVRVKHRSAHMCSKRLNKTIYSSFTALQTITSQIGRRGWVHIQVELRVSRMLRFAQNANFACSHLGGSPASCYLRSSIEWG